MSSLKKPPRGQKVAAHRLVAHTAEEMAGAVYEELMKDNTWYERWKAAHPSLQGSALQRAFIKVVAPGMVQRARATLAGMLGNPAYEHLHESIHWALIDDGQFTRTPRHIFRP